MYPKQRKNYKELNRKALVDRYTNLDSNDPFKEEFAEESAEGLGGSSIKRGNNIINQEQYFRDMSKLLLNKEALEDMLEEKNL